MSKVILLAVVVILCVVGCSTTPNNEDQYRHQEQREEQARWENWCLSNHGVVHIDDVRGRKCYTRKEFLRALQK